MATLAERVGDPALAAAIEALRRNELEVDEAPYLQVDQRIYLLVVLGRVWKWVTETAKWVGSGLYHFFIEPFTRQDLVVVPLRNRGEAPVGFKEVEGRSGIHALMQMAVHVDTLKQTIDGYGTLGAALERLPTFGAAIRQRHEEIELAALVAAEGGGGDAPGEDAFQVALRERRSLEEALDIPLIRQVLQNVELRSGVLEYLRRVKELDRFFAAYTQAQGEGVEVMTPELERFFELCAFERIAHGDVTELFPHLIPPVRLPLPIATHVQESRSFVHTGNIDTPRGVPRLHRADSVVDRGGVIRGVLDPKFEEKVAASGAAAAAAPTPRKKERLTPHDQGVERRRMHIPLHVLPGEAPSLDALLRNFARAKPPVDFAYTRHEIARRAEAKDSEVRRAFTYPPMHICFTLDRIQWQDQGIQTPPRRIVNEQALDIPLEGMVLPEDLLLTGRSPRYNLTGFIAFDSKTGKYAFYKEVERDGAFIEVIDAQMRGVGRPEAMRIARHHAVIVHYARAE